MNTRTCLFSIARGLRVEWMSSDHRFVALEPPLPRHTGCSPSKILRQLFSEKESCPKVPKVRYVNVRPPTNQVCAV